jgi:hypothetical protein
MAIKRNTHPKPLTHAEFTLRAIERLRKGSSHGIHAVFSGFNAAFRSHFSVDPVAAVQKLVEDGTVAIRPCRGGVMIYKADEAPKPADAAGALKKILE